MCLYENAHMFQRIQWCIYIYICREAKNQKRHCKSERMVEKAEKRQPGILDISVWRRCAYHTRIMATIYNLYCNLSYYNNIYHKHIYLLFMNDNNNNHSYEAMILLLSLLLLRASLAMVTMLAELPLRLCVCFVSNQCFIIVIFSKFIWYK